MKIAIALLCCVALTGCATLHARPNYNVPIAAVSKVTLVRCIPQTNPLQCEKIAVTYRPGSEQLIAH